VEFKHARHSRRSVVDTTWRRRRTLPSAVKSFIDRPTYSVDYIQRPALCRARWAIWRDANRRAGLSASAESGFLSSLLQVCWRVAVLLAKSPLWSDLPCVWTRITLLTQYLGYFRYYVKLPYYFCCCACHVYSGKRDTTVLCLCVCLSVCLSVLSPLTLIRFCTASVRFFLSIRGAESCRKKWLVIFESNRDSDSLILEFYPPHLSHIAEKRLIVCGYFRKRASDFQFQFLYRPWLE